MRRERLIHKRHDDAESSPAVASVIPVQDIPEPLPGPDRTLQKMTEYSMQHNTNSTAFIKKIINDMEEVCENGRCQVILKKLGDDIEKAEGRNAKVIKDLIPVAPTKPPWAPRDTPEWSEEFSTELAGFSPNSIYPVDKVRCNNKWCATLQVHYLEQKLEPKGGSWTLWFNEFPPGRAHCPDGHVVMRVQCSGMFCSKLRLLCRRPDAKVWQVDDDATEEMGWFNEEHPGVGACTAGYALTGMKCSGLFCHSKRLLCKGTKPPKRDCSWGAWSEWSECRGMCGYAFNHRNRSIWFPEKWGGRCDGVDAGKKRCNMESCTA